MDAEFYPKDDVATFINDHFIPVKVHIKEQPASFKRFDAVWTPTVAILDDTGKERYRNEGWLPPDEMMAQLTLGLARIAVDHKKWGEAEQLFKTVLEKYPNTKSAAAAQYWDGVSRYSASHDPAILKQTAKDFQSRYSDSIWAKRAAIWSSE